MITYKKYICILLVLSFVLIPNVISKAEEEFVCSDELQLCMDFEIIKPEDYDENNQYISKKAFAYIAARLNGIDIDKIKETEKGKYLMTMGFLKEYSESDFLGESYISFGLAANILVVIAGYEQYALNLGPYSASYQRVAQELKITSGIERKTSDNMTINQVAKMVYNTFSVPYMRYISVGYGGVSYETKRDITVLSEKLDIHKKNGILTATDLTGLYFVEDRVGKDYIKIDTHLMRTNKSFVDYTGMNLTYYYREHTDGADDELLAVIPNKISNTLRINAQQLIKEASEYGFDKIVYEENGKATEAILDNEAVWLFNGVACPDMTIEMLKPDIGEIVLISNNNSNAYNVLSVWSYQSVMVENYNFETGDLLTRNKEIIELDSSLFRKIDVVDSEGNRMFLIDIKFGVTVSIAKSVDGSYIKIILSKSRVNGTISETEESGEGLYVYIRDEKYKVSKAFKESERSIVDMIQVGLMGNFYIDAFGMIVDIDAKGVEGLNVGYLIETHESISGIDKRVFLKILTKSGNIEVFSCASKVSVDSQPFVSGKDIIQALKNSNNQIERTIIRYSLNNKMEVFEIDLPYITEPKPNESINTLKHLFDSGSSKLYHKSTQNLFGGNAPTDGSTIVFKVPAREAAVVSDEDFSVGTISTVPGEASYRIGAYCIGQETLMADYLCIYSDDTGGVPVVDQRDGHFAIIKRITSILHDDEVVQKVECIWRGSHMEYLTKENNVFPQGSVNEGDVVFFLLHNDRVRTFLRVYDCENDMYLLPANPSPSTYYLNEYRTVYGSALRKENGFVQFVRDKNPLSETAEKEVCKASAFKITVIDMTKSNNRVFMGSVDDVDTYDVSGNKCSRMVVYSSYGDPRFIAVYKY